MRDSKRVERGGKRKMRKNEERESSNDEEDDESGVNSGEDEGNRVCIRLMIGVRLPTL